jgi:hypothetical protein
VVHQSLRLTDALTSQPNNVETVEDALANLTMPETVSDFVVRGGIKVEATKQLFLEELPPVLVLHLKRFSYNNVGGIQKNHKVVGYGGELDISPSILSSAAKNASKTVKYRLTAGEYFVRRGLILNRAGQLSTIMAGPRRAATIPLPCCNKMGNGSTSMTRSLQLSRWRMWPSIEWKRSCGSACPAAPSTVCLIARRTCSSTRGRGSSACMTDRQNDGRLWETVPGRFSSLVTERPSTVVKQAPPVPLVLLPH